MKEYQSRADFDALDLFALRYGMRARASDPATSHAAAQSLDTSTIIAQLSRAYRDAGGRGLTDEEAGDIVGAVSAWKRCSDLRRLGRIVATDRTREGSSGRAQRVCVWAGGAA